MRSGERAATAAMQGNVKELGEKPAASMRKKKGMVRRGKGEKERILRMVLTEKASGGEGRARWRPRRIRAA